MYSPALTVTATVVTIAALGTLLVVGKPLLLPLAVAIMLWYVIDALAVSFARLRLGNRQPFQSVSLLLALLTIVLLVIGVANMVGDTVRQVGDAAPGYQDNVVRILDRVSLLTGTEVTPALQTFAAQINVGAVVSKIAGAMMSLASDAGMVAIYTMFLLIEQRYFAPKLAALFPDPQRAARVRALFQHIQAQIRHYLYLKTLVSAATGLLSYVILLWVEVDYAVFWAFLIFLLNYIPTIGSLLGVLFPATLALLQFDTLTPFVVLLLGLGGIQFMIGNVLEPRLMGSSLNLSPLVVILSLALWGQLWGVTGMFLSVPITVMAMIILAHFPVTRSIAIALSQDGRIDVED